MTARAVVEGDDDAKQENMATREQADAEHFKIESQCWLVKYERRALLISAMKTEPRHLWRLYKITGASINTKWPQTSGVVLYNRNTECVESQGRKAKTPNGLLPKTPETFMDSNHEALQRNEVLIKRGAPFVAFSEKKRVEGKHQGLSFLDLPFRTSVPTQKPVRVHVFYFIFRSLVELSAWRSLWYVTLATGRDVRNETKRSICGTGSDCRLIHCPTNNYQTSSSCPCHLDSKMCVPPSALFTETVDC